MPAPPIEWTVDADAWREALEAHAALGLPARHPLQLDAPESDRCVRITDDEARVGRHRFEPIYAEHFGTSVQSHWLDLFYDAHYPGSAFVVPFAPHQRALAEQGAERLHRTLADNARERAEARARPVWHNHLLDWVEAHFVLAMLLLFFVLIPGASILVAWLFGGGG